MVPYGVTLGFPHGLVAGNGETSDTVRKPNSLQGFELIDPSTETWDVQLVTQNFCRHDTKLILQIQIRDLYKDFVAWHFDSKGLFTV
jgi:hypothetical protein